MAALGFSHMSFCAHTSVSHPFSARLLPQVTIFNSLVLTMIGNVGSACEEDAILEDFTSGCNSTVEASQVLPLDIHCTYFFAFANLYILPLSNSSLVTLWDILQRRFTAVNS